MLLVDTYTDLFMPYADSKVAYALYKGGPMKYALRGGSGMSYAWLIQHSMPNIVKVCGKEVSLILALPLLWYFLYETK